MGLTTRSVHVRGVWITLRVQLGWDRHELLRSRGGTCREGTGGAVLIAAFLSNNAGSNWLMHCKLFLMSLRIM